MVSPLLALVSLLAVASELTLAAPSGNLHIVPRAESHEVLALFKRQSTGNYPPGGAVPPASSLPKEWTDKLSALTLPNIPVATDPSNSGRPTYAGFSPTSPEVCSFTYECDSPTDLKVPPAGRLALTFDDGPAEGTESLQTLLRELGARGEVTHFMIGSYMLRFPELFTSVAQGGGHIAVHTWSHQHMTTLSNEAIVGELGWTMQLMADRNGGRIPRYWRPPFGDVDNRVRAIARGVFGLETVTWSQDTGDWNLDQGGAATIENVSQKFIGWLADKSVGLNVLEHEVRPSQPQVLKNVYPRAKALGWQVGNVADSWGMPWYHNAQNANSTVTPMSVGAAAPSMSGVSASRSASVSGAASSSASSISSAASSASASAAASSIRPSTSLSTVRPSASGSAGTVNAAAATSSRSAGHSLERKSAMAGAVGAIVGWLLM